MNPMSPMNPTSRGPLIIKIGGAGVDEPRRTPDLWRAIGRAHRLLEGQLVLVHGGGRAVDAQLERLGMTTERREGIRITPPNQLAQIVAVLAGSVNKALVGAIQAHADVPAVGLCLGDGSALRTVKATRYSFDPGRVGEVQAGGESRLLRTLMQAGFLPVLCSIGLDDGGEFLNVNADDAAAGIAHALAARGLVLLTDVEGIRGPGGGTLAETDEAEIESLIASGVISGGMIPKARAAARAAAAAGAPATIASGSRPDALVRVASGEQAGTRVLPTVNSRR
jgi:acetylglutamate kinase